MAGRGLLEVIGMSQRTRLAAAAIILVFLFQATMPAGAGSPAVAPSARVPADLVSSASTTTFSLDGVRLKLTTSFTSDPTFLSPDPDSAIQTAAAVERAPRFREFSITAAPFGASPPTETVPAAAPGQEGAYRAALRAYREEQGGGPWDGALMRLFGDDVIGFTSVVDVHLRGEEPVPVAITEWVVEAGPRLWIVRASQELKRDEALQPSMGALVISFSDSVLSSRDLAQPSTSLRAMERGRPLPEHARVATGQASDLPAPPWWEGECDTVNFRAATGVAAYPLGAEYRGMRACGPRPWADGGPERWVDFGAGNSQIEWQCPEISKRFLYLAYGIPPYPANGSQVVSNYTGNVLEKVWNCTSGRAPQPDDVLSYGATTTYGHTSVVVASHVDATGNGTVEVIEQNSSPDGYGVLDVADWCVAGGYVTGWLHRPDWTVTYYRDESMTDRCATANRADLYLFEAWGDDAPAGACPTDRFSARFSRAIDFHGGVYTFALGYDDGARLMIHGETVVDGWGGSEPHYETRQLEAGSHQITVEYYDNVGDAALTAFWWGPGFELPRDGQGDASRWYAEHWGNDTLWWDPVVTVEEGDGPLDHQWSWGAPDESLPTDHFSSRFQRTVSFDAGRWRFDLFADDGVRFWIDDQPIVDQWQPQRAWFTPTVTLDSGDHHLVVEHYENEEAADIRLGWEQVSDAVRPTAWVIRPLTGTIVATCPITVEAQVDGGLGAVDRVEFHAHYDGRWHHLGDDDASPYSLGWDCRFVRNQRIQLLVHVWNEAGGEFVDLDHHVFVTLDHIDYPQVHLPLIRRSRSGEP